MPLSLERGLFIFSAVAILGSIFLQGAPVTSALWYCTISREHCLVPSASSKNCDLASVAFSRTSRYWVYPSFLLLPVSSCGPVTANALFCGTTPPRPPPSPCSLLIGWAPLLLSRTQWLGLAVGVSDLPPLPLTGHAHSPVRFPVDLRFLLPSCHTLR